MNDKATDYLIAKHEAESNCVLYDHLLEKLKEAAVLAGLHSNALHVVDPARAPTAASRPNVPLISAWAFFPGCSLAWSVCLSLRPWTGPYATCKRLT